MDPSDALIEIYRQGYTTLLQRLLERESRGTATAYERALLRETEQILTEIDNQSREWIEQEIPRIYKSGQQQAIRSLAEQGVNTEGVTARITGIHRSAVETIAQNMYADLRGAERLVGRRVQDAVRQAGLEATARGLSTGETVRERKKHLQDILGQQGLKSIEDQSGRQWRLDSYAEMVARTTTREATNLGTFNQLEGMGYDLVQMSTHFPTCDICAQYQGRVYSRSGEDTRFPALYETVLSEGYETLHPNCFPAGVAVSGPLVIGQSTRRYEGQMVVITTASGVELPVTPNHPILTSKGWVAAGMLNEGDQVFQYIGQERVIESVDPDDVEIPVLIEDVARSFRKTGTVSAVVMPMSAEDFHGDGSDGNVTVVYANRLLVDRLKATLIQPGSQDRFGSAVGFPARLSGLSALYHLGFGSLDATDGIMSRCGECGTFVGSHAGHTTAHSFGSRRSGKNSALLESFVNHHLSNAEMTGNVALRHSGLIETDSLVNVEDFTPLSRGTAFNSALSKTPVDGGFADTELVSDLFSRLSGEITTDTIVNIERSDFVGHVYNLETTEGWYASNTIITHNCRHVFAPAVAELMSPEELAASQERSNQPFEDNRSERELNAYRNEQRKKRWQYETRRMRERYAALLPNDTPPPGAFARMRQADSERWKELQSLYRDARSELREVAG